MYQVFAFLTIATATLAGYAGGTPWLCLILALALTAISTVENAETYAAALRVKAYAMAAETLACSLANGTLAAAAAYALGWGSRALWFPA